MLIQYSLVLENKHFPHFLTDFKKRQAKKKYISTEGRTIQNQPRIRRDLIKRNKYLVPNSLVISRGCPHTIAIFVIKIPSSKEANHFIPSK